MELKRSSGILLHITSLPSPFGIGDLGPAAYEFIDFLKASGHTYWQLLPLNPTDGKYDHSPYSSFSAFAGNPLLISPEVLERDGYLDLKKYQPSNEFSEKKVNFQAVQDYKEGIFTAVFEKFQTQGKDPTFIKFCSDHSSWLDDYSLYMALWAKFGTSSWATWPEEYRDREPKAIRKAEKELTKAILKVKFLQYLFFSQWELLVAYAHKNAISFIGDIPFYINHESSDCWSHPSCFKLDEEKKPVKISGVPPDYFSEDGQLWGTPVFDWKKLKALDFEWWLKRLQQNLHLFDLVRLDHFRAFSAYWEVPADEETARNGKWIKTPGTAFFNRVKKQFPEMPFIAEDLGTLDEPVYKLLERFNFPGMKVLQFAFGENFSENPYVPYNYQAHNLVYTGTHDNNTTQGWFASLVKSERDLLKKYANEAVNSRNAHKVLHRMALNSVAKIAMAPLQDIIGLGEEAIMNIPGTTTGNWTWRVTSEEIPWKKVTELKDLNSLFGRG